MASANNGIYVTEVAGALVVNSGVSTAGDIRLTVRDSAAAGEDLIVPVGESITTTGSISLLAGDNVLIGSSAIIQSGVALTIWGDYGDADPGVGSNVQIFGNLSSVEILVTGGRDADTLYLHPQSLSGHVRVLGDQDGLAGGDDTIILDQLPTLTSSHDRPGDGLGVIRDTVDLDGRGGGDSYIINLTGQSDIRINVFDSGNPGDGADILTLNGVTGMAPNRNNDTFLVRANFVALMQ